MVYIIIQKFIFDVPYLHAKSTKAKGSSDNTTKLEDCVIVQKIKNKVN